MWCTQTVFLPADAPTRSSVQWFAADPAAGTLVQRGLIDDAAGGTFYAFPSIAVNRRNDVLIGYTRFTANDYPSAGFAFRTAGPAGQLGAQAFQPAVVKPGEAPYVGRGADESSNRWGDFSATVVDPADGLGFWTIQEYAAIPTELLPRPLGYVVGGCFSDGGSRASVDSCASVSASTSVPWAMSSGDAYSSGRWLTPPRQGINSMAVGAMRDMNNES